MSEWELTAVNKMCHLVKDQYVPVKGDNKPYIGLEHIEQKSLRLNSVGTSDQVTSNKFIFRKGHTLFGKLRPYFRKVVRPTFDGICSTDIWVVENELLTDPSFLFYFFSQNEFVDLANSSDTGTRMPRADWNFMAKTEWMVPSLPEQQAIAEVLSSLDDKIDLLHVNNQTLEEMAETVYRRALEQGSTMIALGTIIDIHDSKRVPLSSIEREKMQTGQLYPYYGAATIMDYVNEYIFDGEYLLVGEDGTVQTEEGYPILQRTTGRCWVNNHTHVLSAYPPFNLDLLEIILRNTNVSHIVTGAVQPKINQAGLKSLEIEVPSSNVTNLSGAIKTLLDKRAANRRQISQLEEFRDLLLPKLMSGQVRVTYQ